MIQDLRGTGLVDRGHVLLILAGLSFCAFLSVPVPLCAGLAVSLSACPSRTADYGRAEGAAGGAQYQAHQCGRATHQTSFFCHFSCSRCLNGLFSSDAGAQTRQHHHDEACAGAAGGAGAAHDGDRPPDFAVGVRQMKREGGARGSERKRVCARACARQLFINARCLSVYSEAFANAGAAIVFPLR